ncbi:LysR family transcriptional regulator [Enterovibrio nigricans]|uniref:DNA-binding transcriptional regulator, LysR family n=1 Tax=Enterovibrio nigricans DSM 22720 TaxID=1121868 RepID=A0A1T4W9P2_9GAMM|nr:LysR family transcriptional regulator [Enterovibrio nigricans]PKF48776.1 LysR family transcriptional regulator [Enterovibrio nigricans]SKA73996.1 DNA-binding transcriptional regulator, LysR family [Enterovibrio nigricans DSM 22720]
MDKLEAMRTFVRVTEAGNFSRTAADFGVSPSYISKQMAYLESVLGVRLLQRTTRSISLTQAGEQYLVQCQQILEHVSVAEANLTELKGAPSGRLRISFSSILGEKNTAACCTEFMQLYPDVDLDILIDDRIVDLVEEGFDLCIRASTQMPDSSLIRKNIGQMTTHLLASRDYIEKYGEPMHPSDLVTHRFIGHTYVKNSVFTFQHDNGIEKVAIPKKVRVNSTYFVRQMVETGEGIAFLPAYFKRANPDLVTLLPHCHPSSIDISAVYPERAFTPAKTHKFIAFFQEWFQRHMGEY